MIEINLLKFIDKSFSEISEALHPDKIIEVPEKELEEAGLSKTLYKERKKSKVAIIVITLSIVVLAFITVTVNYYLNKEKAKIEIVKKEVEKSVILPSENKTDSENIKKISDVIVVGTIEILDEIPDIVKVDKHIDIPLKRDETIKREKVPLEKPVSTTEVTTYRLVLSDLNEKTLDKIKKEVSKNKHLKLKILKENTKTISNWAVYKPTHGTKKFIAGREVSFVKSFKSKKDAINFAKKHVRPAIVKKELKKYETYDILVESFKDYNEAQKFFKKFNIDKNKVKISAFS